MPISIKSVSDTVLRIAMMLVSLVFSGALVALIIYLIGKWKRYSQYKCIIWGLDGFGQPIQKTDKAGVFVDKKTNIKRLFLKKARVGLNADNVPFIHQGKKRVIYLHQFGLKNFRFIKPRIEENVTFQVGEEDVNWSINSYERGKKTFSQDKLMQYLPFIALGFVSIVILIIFIYLFKKLDVLVEFAEASKELAKTAAEIKTGTTIIK